MTVGKMGKQGLRVESNQKKTGQVTSIGDSGKKKQDNPMWSRDLTFPGEKKGETYTLISRCTPFLLKSWVIPVPVRMQAMSTVRLADQISVLGRLPEASITFSMAAACDLPFHPVKPQQDKTPAHRHSERVHLHSDPQIQRGVCNARCEVAYEKKVKLKPKKRPERWMNTIPTLYSLIYFRLPSSRNPKQLKGRNMLSPRMRGAGGIRATQGFHHWTPTPWQNLSSSSGFHGNKEVGVMTMPPLKQRPEART